MRTLLLLTGRWSLERLSSTQQQFRCLRYPATGSLGIFAQTCPATKAADARRNPAPQSGSSFTTEARHHLGKVSSPLNSRVRSEHFVKHPPNAQMSARFIRAACRALDSRSHVGGRAQKIIRACVAAMLSVVGISDSVIHWFATRSHFG
jgi:hypothetical protein